MSSTYFHPTFLYTDFGSAIVVYLFFLAVIITGVVLLLKRRVGAIHASKVFPLDDILISAEEFYESLEKIIEEKDMPNVRFSRVNYSESHMFSASREYFRVSRHDDIFDICAAPFGTGSFVSYWHGEPKRKLRELAQNVPYLSSVIHESRGKTRYEVDTEVLFQDKIKESITKAIDEITVQKGVRLSNEAIRHS